MAFTYTGVVFLLLAYFAGGAIIDLAVAWGCAMAVQIAPGSPIVFGKATPVKTTDTGILLMAFHAPWSVGVTSAWLYRQFGGNADGDHLL